MTTRKRDLIDYRDPRVRFFLTEKYQGHVATDPIRLAALGRYEAEDRANELWTTKHERMAIYAMAVDGEMELVWEKESEEYAEAKHEARQEADITAHERMLDETADY